MWKISFYLTLDFVEKGIEGILLRLIQNQNILKCLKYPSSDALNLPNLSEDDIEKLINQEGDVAETRIFFTPFDVETPDSERAELRFFFRAFVPNQNSVLSSVNIQFEVIVSDRIWRLDNGRQRPITIVSEILKTLNGQDIDGLGKIYFNNPIRVIRYNKYFSGYGFHPTTWVV